MPVPVTKQDITNVAPEFQAVAEQTVDLYIGLARRFVSESRWGDMSFQGIVQMAAHLLKKSGYGYGTDGTGSSGGIATGPILSESVGEISRTYANVGNGSGNSQADMILATTSYGQLFMMLRSTLVRTPFVV